MAVIATISSYRVSILLDAGTSSSGTVVTSSVAFPGLVQTGLDSSGYEKLFTIVDAFEPLAEDDVYTVRETTTKTLSS